MEERGGGDPGPGSAFGPRIANALLMAREVSRLSVDDFAIQMRFLLRREVSSAEVLASEKGSIPITADYLLAAGRTCTTPISILLGEWNYEEERLDRLEAEIRSLAEGDS